MTNNFLIILRVPIQIIMLVILTSFLNGVMEDKRERGKWMNPSLFISLGIHRYLYNFIFLNENRYEFPLIALQIFIYLAFCKKGKIIEKIFWSLSATGMIILGYMVSYATTSYVYNLPLREVVLRRKDFFMSYGLGPIISTAIFFIVNRNKVELKYLTDAIVVFFIGLMTVEIVKIWRISYKIFQEGKNLTSEDLWWYYEVLLIFFGITKVVGIVSNQTKKFVESELKERNNHEIEKHTREIYEVIKKLKTWSHDWKNHMIAISYFLEKNELEKLKGYISQVKGESGEVFESVDIVKTGKTIIDALFNSKNIVAKSHNIKMDIEVGMEENFGVSDIDLCVILGNLLDNALEANSNGGWIKFKMYNVKGNIVMVMDNSINEKIIQEGDKFITRKGYGFHGIGLIQIDETVKKYGGELIRVAKNGVFYTKIVIPNLND